jgi:tRNA dimethylallyltransferase
LAGSRAPRSLLPSGLVVAVFGPTASGKTAVAEAVAARAGGEVVSADSMQAYRGLTILTAQPERPTRLVAIWPLSHEGSVAEYAQLAHAEIDALLADGRTPVVAGGTGLYLRAALVDLGVPPAPSPELRARYERLYDRLGAERAHAVLEERDAEAAGRVHANDRRRVVRALELGEAGASLRPAEDRLWEGETRHPTLIVGLTLDREELRRRIEQRTCEMFERGVEEEVRRALAGPISDTARHIHGLREIAELPREQAIEAIVIRGRRYGVYQLRWLRRIPGIVSLPADRPPGELADAILEMARSRERLPARRAGDAGRPVDA